jgi:hypothetical protein
MENQVEIWKDVKGYESFYQVSSLGKVKSLNRTILKNGIHHFRLKEKIIKPSITRGYYTVGLHKKGTVKNRSIHQLVAESFLGHNRCGSKLVVNHINLNKLDNRVSNLEIVSARYNSTHRLNLHKKTSKYIGVSKIKNSNKWKALIVINKKQISLGYFNDENEASTYYKNALVNHEKGLPIDVKKPIFKSKYKGVSFYKNVWIARINKNKKTIYLGSFKTEIEAYERYLSEKEKM